jgi:hypothetical protein
MNVVVIHRLLVLLQVHFFIKNIQIKSIFFNFIETPSTTKPSISFNACKYHDSRYGTIDLSSIGSATGKPKFKDVASIYPNNYRWSYNPCYTFSEDSCQNVAGCQSKIFH